MTTYISTLHVHNGKEYPEADLPVAETTTYETFLDAVNAMNDHVRTVESAGGYKAADIDFDDEHVGQFFRDEDGVAKVIQIRPEGYENKVGKGD